MDIESIEVKARLEYNHDRLDAVVNEMPDSLKKRVRMFINAESKSLTDKMFRAKEEGDFELVQNGLKEIRFLGRLSELQEELEG